MITTAPHYLLFTEAKQISETSVGGRWRFILEQIGSETRIEEADLEPGVTGERLQLLAVVRGLESLEQVSRVTLITPSKYVGRGIRRGLTQWRQNNWKWERFGIQTVIKNHDLWQRIDHAMQIHHINCRVWQFDPPEARSHVADEHQQPEFTGVRLYSAPSNADVSRTTDPLRRRRSPISVGVSGKQEFQEVENLPGNGGHVRLDLKPNRRNMGAKSDQVNRVSEFLADKIKPIGEGRAFGYAVS